MYLDCVVDVPDIPGKITHQKKKNAVYIDFEYERIYYPERKYTIPKRVTIGKLDPDNPERMVPNENFLKYFPEVELPVEKGTVRRSYTLKVGAFLVLEQIVEAYKLPALLDRYFNSPDLGLFLDLAIYSIICENNASQYYPDYAYNHPLFTENMHIYSDSKISSFLSQMTDEQSMGFLNDWNAARDHREKIYISYDSTNKNCQAGDLELVEFGHPKIDLGCPIFNYAIAYDTSNQVPLFYEEYPGSIVDVSQLQYMLDRAYAYGYRKIGFILDRGYFSRQNIEYMDQYGYDFVMMLKGRARLVNELIMAHRGSFEESWKCRVKAYDVSGITVRHKFYESDRNDRYFHLFHSDEKQTWERSALKAKVERMAALMAPYQGKVMSVPDSYNQYFEVFYDQDGTFLALKEKEAVLERELKLCGYFVIVTSKKMTAEEAITLYKGRDVSEKLFRGSKSYLGNKSLRVHSNESASAKIFIEFVATIIRSRLYILLKAEMVNNDRKANYMTVPAALRELEKIEMTKMGDGNYRLNHAVTATQKAILKAFRLDVADIKNKTNQINERLKGEL